jgi:Do/DeqQ family serine protease
MFRFGHAVAPFRVAFSLRATTMKDMPRMLERTAAKLMAAALVLGLAGAAGAAVPALAQERQVPAGAADVRLSFAPIVKRVAPAVVNVYASRVVEQQSPFFSDPFFRQFFGGRFGGGGTRVQRSLGSGVIVDPSGVIVTNLHVIQHADEVKVALADRREFSAAIILRDERSDLAVLRIDDGGTAFPTLDFADSDSVEVGDLVLAIGDPFGVGQTVTSGIVSAMAHVPGGPAEDQLFIQTDAAINPGNSGGALVDIDGRLIGVNRMIVSPSGASSGIGFAIPSNLVRVITEAALTGHAPRRPWLGVDVQPVTPDIAVALGVVTPVGAVVADVDADGPAAVVGIKVNDLIVSIDGVEVADPGALNYHLATKGIGGTVDLGVIRDGKKYIATVPLESAPETVPRDARTIDGGSPLAGAVVANLSPAVAEEIGYRGSLDGVIVIDVADGSPAAAAGLSRGDVIVDVNGAGIDSTQKLASAAAERTRQWRLTLRRDGRLLRWQFRG